MPIVLPSPSRPTLTEPSYVAAPVWKPVLAWAGLVMGGLVVVAAVGTVGDGVLESLAMTLIGLAMAIPGAWWLHCERADRTHAEEDYRLDRQAALAARSMAGYVSADALGPLTWHTPLTPFARRWPLVGGASAALLVVGGVLMPAGEPSALPPSNPAAATSTVTTTARAAAGTTRPTSTAPRSTASTSATPTSTDALAAVPTVDPEPTPPPAPVETYVAPETYAPQSYAPAPLAEPVPQAAYYSNCSAARAAGAAPLYRGQAGYAPKLDRDNDGVACE